MRSRIDSRGRLLVPKALRDALGFASGTEVELTAEDDHLVVSFVPRVRVVEGAHGPVITADGAAPLTVDDVRRLIEEIRR